MRMGAKNVAISVVSSTSLLLLVACGGSSHTSNASACRLVVADLHKVAAALQTVSTQAKAFPAKAADLNKALAADVKGLPKGTLQTAVQDFGTHLSNVGTSLAAGKPASTSDAVAFGTDAQQINSVCKAAGVPANG
jgi:hypothetical protein